MTTRFRLPLDFQAGLVRTVNRLLDVSREMLPPSVAELLTSLLDTLLLDHSHMAHQIELTPEARSSEEEVALNAPMGIPLESGCSATVKDDSFTFNSKDAQSEIASRLLVNTFTQTSPQKIRHTVDDLTDSNTQNDNHNLSPNNTLDGLAEPCFPEKSVFCATGDLTKSFPHVFARERSRNLDWCRWPVCMAHYLGQKCPFGENSCPEAHVSPALADAINDKGLVRVCFDALGVGGRICLRKPGFCRFFHAPAHIRYQLLELRHDNRLSNYRRNSIEHNFSVYPSFYHSGQNPQYNSQSLPDSVTQTSTQNQSDHGPNTDVTLSVAIVAALVARLLESRIYQIPGAAEKLMAALYGSGLDELQNPPQHNVQPCLVQQPMYTYTNATPEENQNGVQPYLGNYYANY
ncbi:Sphingosine phosphate lyase [Paragonimus heterotremus]|uniref:Sphingosine phosphate lyase n=1 Tax=Paragonimus heterotremus TaxID=100268 RepID=A0A8J4T3I5_9TREM|nr:Sphingosine phosphate lyase [Paragonimus heterotremus]